MSNARSPDAPWPITVGIPARIFVPPCGTMATLRLPNVPQAAGSGNRSVADPRSGAVMDDEFHEETIEAAPEDVWGFMVDPGALSAWFGADAWLEPRPGGAVRFRFAGGIERRGSVEGVRPFRELRWRWREHRGAGFGST